eukprot:452433-Amphidinium_carterae.1
MRSQSSKAARCPTFYLYALGSSNANPPRARTPTTSSSVETVSDQQLPSRRSLAEYQSPVIASNPQSTT